MAGRPIWKGYIKFSMVTFPVNLHSAQSDSEKITFNQINRHTGNRIKQAIFDSVTNDPVERCDVRKGYQVAKNQYVEMSDEDFESIKIESSHTIWIDYFSSIWEINPLYFDTPYYITVSDKVGYESYALLHAAMSKEEKVGIGNVVLFRRERPIALIPYDKGFIGYTLNHAYKVRDCADYFEDIVPAVLTLEKEALDLASLLIQHKTKEFDTSKFIDRYEVALAELIKNKIADVVIKEEEGVKPQPAYKAQAIMDILRAAAQHENIKIPEIKIPTTPPSKRKRKAAA